MVLALPLKIYADENIEIQSCQKHDVLINEVAWSGSMTNWRDEWIELKNNTDYDIDITGWEVQNLGSSGRSIYIQDDKDNEKRYKIPARGFFLISRYQMGDDRSILNIESDLTASVSLADENNGNLILKDLAGNIIDEAKGDTWPAGNKNKRYSMERGVNIGDGLLLSSWHTATESINLVSGRLEKATPKEINSPPIFKPCENNYSIDVTNYINLDIQHCMEAEVYVLYVIDGDTIGVDLNGEDQRVRLIGIDSPEGYRSSRLKINEPYYEEAKEYAINELANKKIKIIVSILDMYDSYNRLLSAVVVDDKIFNIASIQNGFSRAYYDYLSHPLIISEQWMTEELLSKQRQVNIWKYHNKDLPIIINEFMPNPAGADDQNEWIELFNPRSHSVDIGNLIIDDEEGGSKPYLIPRGTVIGPNGYLIISIKESQISLNNNGDSVRLLRSDLTVAEEIRYLQTAKEEISYARFAHGFAWTKTPTKGSKNIYTDPNAVEYKQVEKISHLHQHNPQTNVEISGYVNTCPHQISDQYFYIQDDTAGVQIYNFFKNFPNLKIGQKVRIIGQITASRILRIKINDLSDIFLLDDFIVFDPPKLKPSLVNNRHIGQLISVKGEIFKLSGQIFYIKDEYSQLRIQIRAPTNFKRPDLKRGDIIEVTGVLYQSSRGNVTLLPRYLSDILVVQLAYRPSKRNLPFMLGSIGDLQNIKKDEWVMVKGVVNSLPGHLSERYFYIQDDTAGVQIYSHYKDFPNLKIGDEVEVLGKISANKLRIRTYSQHDIRIIEQDINLQHITIAHSEQMGDYYGMLSFVEGIVISKKGQVITLSVDGEKIILYIRKINNLKPSILKTGDRVKLFGIIEYISDEHRIVPRSIEDIYYERIINKKKSTSSVKGASTLFKKYKKLLGMPKSNKYLDKNDQSKYNRLINNNISKTIIVISQMLCIMIIACLLCKKNIS
jgi:endonuclease YncB( thermonuclease family)